MTNKEFIEMISSKVCLVAISRGYNYPSAIIAQACNESAYGRSSLGKNYNNFFGMKCGGSWNGKSVNLATKEEYTVGTLTDIRDNFRVYDSVEDGVIGYLDFIQYDRYSNLKDATSCRDYLEKIKSDGYATSSTYVENLMNIVNQYDLTKYDVVSSSQLENTKTNDEIADEVISGKWGNGNERRCKLTDCGYDYDTIQSIVNEKLGNGNATEESKKSDTEIAKEVIRGEWGNGLERKQRLTAEGYNYNTIQSIVNSMM